MHRYSRPCRFSIQSGSAYRRKRKCLPNTVFIIMAVIVAFILLCIMPLWLICAILGLVAGFLIAVIFSNTRR